MRSSDEVAKHPAKYRPADGRPQHAWLEVQLLGSIRSESVHYANNERMANPAVSHGPGTGPLPLPIRVCLSTMSDITQLG